LKTGLVVIIIVIYCVQEPARSHTLFVVCCVLCTAYLHYILQRVCLYSVENEVTYIYMIQYNNILYILLSCTQYFFMMNAADLRRAAHNHPMQRVRIIFVSRVPIYTHLRHIIIIRVWCSTLIYIQKNSTLSSNTHTHTHVRVFIIACKFYASAQMTAT